MGWDEIILVSENLRFLMFILFYRMILLINLYNDQKIYESI